MPGRREFKRLLVAAFVSQTGSHFLTLSITAFVYLASDSAPKAAMVFVLSYLPSVLMSGTFGPWVDKRISRRFLIANEMVSIAASVACGLALWAKAPLFVLGFFIALRSLCLFTSRSGLTKWVKTISPPEVQKARIQLFFLTFFLSTGVSGILAAVVLSKLSILTIIAFDAATYLLSALLLSRLQELPKAASGPAAVGFPITRVLADPLLRPAAVSVAFSQALFQGAYSVLVTYLPVHQLGLGLSGVGFFQLAATLGILAGFVVNWKSKRLVSTELLANTAGVALLSLAQISSLPAALVSFWVLNFAYECVWLNKSSEFFQAMPENESASLQFALNSGASFLMAIFTLLYAFGIEAWGIGSALPAIAIAGGLAWAFLLLKKPVPAEARP